MCPREQVGARSQTLSERIQEKQHSLRVGVGGTSQPSRGATSTKQRSGEAQRLRGDVGQQANR
jgi:hypothetical protein